MAFPAYLVLSSDDFGEEQEPNVYRTEMDGGMPKQAAKFSRATYERTVTYMAVTAADYQSFLIWFRQTVHFGADWFDWTDPVDSVVKKARIKEGRYSAKPWTPTLSRWDITFRIETMVS